MAPQGIDKVEQLTIQSILKDSFTYDSLTFEFKQQLVTKQNNISFYVKYYDDTYIFNSISNLKTANIILNLTNDKATKSVDESKFPIIRISDDLLKIDSLIFLFDRFQNSILIYNILTNQINKKIELKENPFLGNFTEEQVKQLKSLNLYKPKILRLYEINKSIFVEIEIFNKFEIDTITDENGKVEFEKTYSSENFIYLIDTDSFKFVKQKCENFNNSFFMTKGYSAINDSVFVSELYTTDNYLNKDNFNKRIALININNCQIIDSVSSKRLTPSSMFGFTSKIYNFDDFILNFNFFQKTSSIHHIEGDSIRSFNSELYNICDSIIKEITANEFKLIDYSITYIEDNLIFSFIIDDVKNKSKIQLMIIFEKSLSNLSYLIFKSGDELISSNFVSDKKILYILYQFKNERWILKKANAID